MKLQLVNEGLAPSTEYFRAQDKTGRLELDAAFDRAAPTDYSRTDAVYAYPEREIASDWRLNGGIAKPGMVIMEVKIDPKNALVTDQDIFSQASDEHSSPAEQAESYWQQAMTLEQFLQLPEEQRRSKYVLPEVVIPHTVDSQYMRVASIVLPEDNPV